MYLKVRAGQAQITKILLHAGAEPELKNAFGLTPFLLSCFKGKIFL